jgi:hypothetical protein
MRLTLVGYWRSEQHPEWPDPGNFLDLDWDGLERHMTSMYLASGTIARTFMGYASCRICGRQNGDME